MKRKYEAIVVLDTRGKEDSIEKMISQLGRDIESEGARLEQIDQIGRKKFAYSPRKVDEGFYVNFQFEMEPENLGKVKSRLKLNQGVFLQHYQKREA